MRKPEERGRGGGSKENRGKNCARIFFCFCEERGGGGYTPYIVFLRVDVCRRM